MNLQQLGEATYVALETFKRNGEAVNTPVWLAPEGDKLYVLTQGDSWKVKRLKNNGRARLAKSDARGTPEGEFVEATGRVLEDEASLAAHRQRMVKKYGWQYRLFMLFAKLRGNDTNYVVLEFLHK